MHASIFSRAYFAPLDKSGPPVYKEEGPYKMGGQRPIGRMVNSEVRKQLCVVFVHADTSSTGG